ncbi:MAG: hypothetical protein ACKVQB_01815 [Bacteroidia bacterium]
MKFYKTISALLILAYLAGCKPEKFTTNVADKLSFSFDTIMFDTIISQLYVGTPKSVNRQFVVRNTHKNKKIKTTISLAGGDKSTFRLNVDGEPGIRFDDIEIRPGDSIFVFVEAYANQNHDPNGDALIIHDSIVFLTNGNFQNVQLVAWGQDAHYYYRDSTEVDLVWADKKRPYVVYDFFYIKPGATLTIKEGVKIYFSPYSTLYTEGTLKIEGTAAEMVTMEGDRTSDKNSDRHSAFKYANIPGQWFGLRFGWPSKANEIKYARIKNAVVGIFMDTSSSDGKDIVRVKNTFIQNMTYSAVRGTRSKFYMDNSVLANCGSACLYTFKGGEYDLKQVTISGYCDFGGDNIPALYVTNRLRDGLGRILETYSGLRFKFQNCIAYGDLKDEIGFDVDGSILPEPFTVLGSLMNSTNATLGQSGTQNVLNKDPKFKDFKKYFFNLDSASAAIDIGVNLSIPIDFLDKPRDSKPDAGAFERIQ